MGRGGGEVKILGRLLEIRGVVAERVRRVGSEEHCLPGEGH